MIIIFKGRVMINIKKEIFLKPNSLNKDKEIEFCILDCSVNNKKCDVYTDTEYIKIKYKEFGTLKCREIYLRMSRI